ncbi:PilN domain-containing protein, partial [Arcticibacter sp.]|uniref:PilN domain-containing protein n=1 Tax=Arcticibacter sp. TaxID=1872630 RepID=UPI00388F1CB5
VELTELSVSPVIQAEGNTERQEIYQSGKVSIKGFTGDPIAVNDWIYKLKERAWVQQVQMQRFSPTEEKGIQEFEMSLTY